MSEDIKSIVDIGLEGAAVVLLLTVSYKILRDLEDEVRLQQLELL